MSHPKSSAPMLQFNLLSALSPGVMGHALKRHTLLSRSFLRAAANGMASAELLSFSARPQTWQELLALQQAVLAQLQQRQLEWMNGWFAWMRDYLTIREVNTLSKLAEQECNLAAQFVMLLQAQATDLIDLQENVEVNYGYWLSEVAASGLRRDDQQTLRPSKVTAA